MTVLKYDDHYILVIMVTKWCSPLHFLFVYWVCKFLTRPSVNITMNKILTWSRYNCLVIVMSSAINCDVISRKIMYVLSWRIVSALTRVLFLCLFPSLFCNSGNKHKDNPLVSIETVLYSNTYIILYICAWYPVFLLIRVPLLKSSGPVFWLWLSKVAAIM